ncbi:LacI family DNA-binding transcriptional regulator [Tropicimonas isoalkanivorans]|uniref:Transcriptional regulator, LacI family n=1 Tax=Tropicimonas isoalkanivorans TaxID=441112 RepID=A0A1I1GHW7_9RHOB|nr:LacI family DNA-binding transcriptional regulator [Tropicimonas isoalkanivorans]SFC11377.1 transcriptional regulator, LacI family [Tropicimonas isoalkanivorans]
MTRRAPSIRDVALAAGVSTATVSRTLSAPELVSEKTRESVFEAIRETGYRLNVTARNLRRRKTGAIAVLVPNLSNPFFSRILSGIAEVMSENGFNVLITDTSPLSPDEHRFPEYFSLNQTDGLIVLDGMLSRDLLLNRGAPESRAPMVFACEWIEDIARPRVSVDNREGSALAVQHLAALGHRRIGHIGGPPDNVLTIARKQGTRDALQAAGLPCRAEWVYDGDFTLQSGATAAAHWMASPDRPTAVTCASDEMAMGFIAELYRHGVSVPAEVSVVGFDDLEIAAHFVPPLTTIHQPRADIGRAAARMLLERMATPPQDRNREPVPQVVLPVALVERLSTAPLAGP